MSLESQTARTADIICPTCSKKLDAATHPTKPNIIPRDGDLAICAECLSILRYGNQVTELKLVSKEEINEFPIEEIVLLDRMKRVIREAKKELYESGLK